MTIKEAIETLEANYPDACYEQLREAVDVAIYALKQPEIIRCKDCIHCEHWYADKGRCFLWHEDGIDVFEDGFCNYAERREE